MEQSVHTVPRNSVELGHKDCPDCYFLDLWENAVKINFGFMTIVLAAGLCAIPASSQDGQAIYTKNCAVCHGSDGKADTPAGKAMKAQNFQAAAVVKASDAELESVVKKGKDTMPAFDKTLSDAQIKEVIGYIRGLQAKH